MKHCEKCSGTGLVPIRQHIADTIEYIDSNGCHTSRSVADAMGVSVANASTRLRKMERDGLLKREEYNHESGGAVFVYRVTMDGLTALDHKEGMDSRRGAAR